jgi:cell wall-associated NlpC family hydrolase
MHVMLGGHFMRQDRRSLLLKLLMVPIALSTRMQSAAAQGGSGRPSSATAQPVSDVPDPKTFQSGDFVWPKRKGAVVPKMEQPVSEEQRAWEAARARLLQEDPSKSGLSREAGERLKSMSYGEFETLYFTGMAEPADKGLNIGAQTIYVGHVGIIEIDAKGTPYVIEAVPVPGFKGSVMRTPYADWLKSHSDMQVWHGRVRDLSVGVRKRIVAEAMKQLGKPYEFFNFDLNDDSGFYCSKLAWMSVWRATSRGWRPGPVAVDDDPNPHRPFFGWFSPKELVNAKRVMLLHKPAEY